MSVTADFHNCYSLRQRIFDESIEHYAYRSIHFAIDIIKLKENLKKGYISNVNCEEKNISFKRKHCRQRAPVGNVLSSSVTSQFGMFDNRRRQM
jgi:hypothetical protein